MPIRHYRARRVRLGLPNLPPPAPLRDQVRKKEEPAPKPKPHRGVRIGRVICPRKSLIARPAVKEPQKVSKPKNRSYKSILQAYTEKYNSQRGLDLHPREMEYCLRGYYISLLVLKYDLRSCIRLPDFRKFRRQVMAGFSNGKAHRRITAQIVRLSQASRRNART